jgi:UDP-2,3-diacylglucosamine pyrophosphatase LpxH
VPLISAAAFDQISVVSDLHLGGAFGFQVFGQTDLLASYIDHLRQAGSGECALVLNGDTVDFLAEPGAKYFDPEGAIAKLNRMFGDASLVPVWEALRKFAATPKRHLVIILGNHDLELAMPWVRDHFLNTISGDDDSARSRIKLVLDGTGFCCTVGSATVLCVHGNEVDPWNLTDYEALRRLARDLIQGRPAMEEWVPNAGSKLVIDVMNDVKHEYAFIDLLKPEQTGAVRILLALKPDLRPMLRQVAEVAARRIWDQARRAVGLLSEDAAVESPAGQQDALTRIAVDQYQVAVKIDGLLDRTEKRFLDGADPMDLVYEQQSQQLGWWDALVSVVRQREPYEVAWEAIKELVNDKTFDINQADVDFQRIDESAGPEFDFVITGHTHLARMLSRTKGRGIYLNSGTWASLMRLTPKQLASPKDFQPVFERLSKAKTIADLGDLVWQRPTVVTVRSRNGQMQAALEEVTQKKGTIVLKRLG